MSDDINLTNLMGMAATAESGGNYDEAISYYNRVLETEPTSSEAWLGKGRSAGSLSSLNHLRLTEMFVAFGHAVGSADEACKDDIAGRAQSDVVTICSGLYVVAERHLRQFRTVGSARSTYVKASCAISDALESAGAWGTPSTELLRARVNVGSGLLNFGGSADLMKIMRSRVEAAAALIKAQDEGYAAPLPAAETVVEAEQRKANFEALGYIVLFIVIILAIIIRAAS